MGKAYKAVFWSTSCLTLRDSVGHHRSTKKKNHVLINKAREIGQSPEAQRPPKGKYIKEVYLCSLTRGKSNSTGAAVCFHILLEVFLSLWKLKEKILIAADPQRMPCSFVFQVIHCGWTIRKQCGIIQVWSYAVYRRNCHGQNANPASISPPSSSVNVQFQWAEECDIMCGCLLFGKLV